MITMILITWILATTLVILEVRNFMKPSEIFEIEIIATCKATGKPFILIDEEEILGNTFIHFIDENGFVCVMLYEQFEERFEIHNFNRG